MRTIERSHVIQKIKEALIEINYHLEPDFVQALENAKASESNQVGKKILDEIIENAALSSEETLPMCQDTGTVVAFVEYGKVKLDFDLVSAINEAVKEAYHEGYLRKSMVSHPLLRENTKDNTPAIIHTTLTNSEDLIITLAAKGGGAENMSKIKMMSPAEGRAGVVEFVLNTVKEAGGKACPPFTIGVGIGGNFEQVAVLAKQAILRDLNDKATLEFDAKLEQELLEKINQTDVGPMGFGGDTTALAVKVNTAPTHIASLPVAVNIQCHASRHKKVIL